MGSGTFRIIGLSAFANALTSLDPRDHAQQGVREAAELLRNDISNRAPVDTGHLSQSYSVDMQGSGGGGAARARVSTDVRYARYQEFGTVYQSGQPHFRPAIEANRDQAIQIMGEQTLHSTFNQI